MIRQLAFLFLSLGLTSFLYPVWISLLYRLQFREKIREEGPPTHLQKQGTPTMGGLVFVLVPIGLTLIFNLTRQQTLLPVVIIGAASALGIVEDLFKVYTKSQLRQQVRTRLNPIVTRSKLTSGTYNFLLLPWDLFREFCRTLGSNRDTRLQAHYKFVLQAALALFLALWVYWRLEWSTLWLPLFGDVELGAFYPVLIFFGFIFVLNAVAITDGLDGLAGGLGAVALMAFWGLAVSLSYTSLAVLAAVFVGALLAFLYFNFFPARMFMGDVGAYGLAALLFMIPLIMRREVVGLVVLAVFVLDGGLSGNLQSLAVRFTGRRIFKMAPVHHHFEMLGWPETKVTMRFWLAGIIFAFAGLLVGLL